MSRRHTLFVLLALKELKKFGLEANVGNKPLSFRRKWLEEPETLIVDDTRVDTRDYLFHCVEEKYSEVTDAYGKFR